jgi:HEAT repeat protein
LTLLRVAALRYTAVRQQEDDAVTLLRQADLKGIRLLAVEGFSPVEERPEPGAGGEARQSRGVKPPEGWDTPLPRLPQAGPLAWRPVPARALEGLRSSESEEALASGAMDLARDLLAEAVRGGWAMPNRDLVAFFAELRDYFLAEGKLGPLKQLVDLIGQVGAGEIREEILSRLGDARTLDLVLAALPEGAKELPEELVGLVPLLGFDAALDRLEQETEEVRHALLLRLVLARLPREAPTLLRRLAGLQPGLARTLANGLVACAPEMALEVARFLLGQKDDALRLAGLDSLSRAPEVPIAPVVGLLGDRSEAIRVKAVEVLGRRGDESAWQVLLKALEGSDRSLREVEALGRALAEISPIQASRLLLGWLHPKGRFLVGASAEQKRLQWAAVAGLALIPGEEAERQLLALANGAEEELRKHCLASLARRRKGRSHG